MANANGTPTSRITYASAGASIAPPSTSSRSASVILCASSRFRVEVAQRAPRHGELVGLAFRNAQRDGRRQLGDDRRIGRAAPGDRAVHVAIGAQVLHASHGEAKRTEVLTRPENALREKMLGTKARQGTRWQGRV